VGSRHFPDLDDAILFLEDVGEDLYRVDRMLAHLRTVGALDRLAGVAIGRFTQLQRHMSDGAFGFDEVLATYLEPLGIPVAAGFPIGHIDDQWTLPIGVRARLDAEAGELELLEAAVV
jgi:muramoyltetrapeptide carboxypeptidase